MWHLLDAEQYHNPFKIRPKWLSIRHLVWPMITKRKRASIVEGIVNEIGTNLIIITCKIMPQELNEETSSEDIPKPIIDELPLFQINLLCTYNYKYI